MDVDETLKLALKFHNSNDMEKANRLYDKILAKHGDHPDANHLSGLISLSVGDLEDAMEKIQKAITATPNQAIFYNSLGNVLKSNNKSEQAERAYFSALEIDPRLHEAHHNLGKLFEKNGNLESHSHHWVHKYLLASNIYN
jgi:Flp pilus assembly protein TadD